MSSEKSITLNDSRNFSNIKNFTSTSVKKKIFIQIGCL